MLVHGIELGSSGRATGAPAWTRLPPHPPPTMWLLVSGKKKAGSTLSVSALTEWGHCHILESGVMLVTGQSLRFPKACSLEWVGESDFIILTHAPYLFCTELYKSRSRP